MPGSGLGSRRKPRTPMLLSACHMRRLKESPWASVEMSIRVLSVKDDALVSSFVRFKARVNLKEIEVRW